MNPWHDVELGEDPTERFQCVIDWLYWLTTDLHWQFGTSSTELAVVEQSRAWQGCH